MTTAIRESSLTDVYRVKIYYKENLIRVLVYNIRELQHAIILCCVFSFEDYSILKDIKLKIATNKDCRESFNNEIQDALQELINTIKKDKKE